MKKKEEEKKEEEEDEDGEYVEDVEEAKSDEKHPTTTFRSKGKSGRGQAF